MALSGIIGKKDIQTQGFLQDGTRVPLTVISAMGNVVTQLKTSDRDGYNSIQLGFGIKKHPNKPIIGHSKKAGLDKQPRFFKELRADDLDGIVLGAEVVVSDVLKPGDIVDVTGISKGKGFAGVVKRHNFRGGPRTHGQSDRERAPGSIGQTTTPGRVYRGKRMAGRMGHENVTIKNLEVIEITNDGALLIKGLVPGSVNTIVVVRKVGENKKFVPLFKESEEKIEEVIVEAVAENVQAEEVVAAELVQSETAQTEPVVEEVKVEETIAPAVEEKIEVQNETKETEEPKEEVKDAS